MWLSKKPSNKVHGSGKTFDFSLLFNIFDPVITGHRINKNGGDTLTPQSGFGLVFLGQEDGQDAVSQLRITRVWRSSLRVLVVVIKFPIQPLTCKIEGSEIMFAVWVIVRRERIKTANPMNNFSLDRSRKIENPTGQHDLTSGKTFSRSIIQRCNLAGLLVM